MSPSKSNMSTIKMKVDFLKKNKISTIAQVKRTKHLLLIGKILDKLIQIGNTELTRY